MRFLGWKRSWKHDRCPSWFQVGGGLVGIFVCRSSPTMATLIPFFKSGHTFSRRVEGSAEIARGTVLLRTIKDVFLSPFGIEKLCGCESLQDRHGCMATWASPKSGCRLSRGLLRQGREEEREKARAH